MPPFFAIAAYAISVASLRPDLLTVIIGAISGNFASKRSSLDLACGSSGSW